MTLYTLQDLQACEPDAIDWRDDRVRVSIRNERDDMGFDRVDLYSDSITALIRFVANEWGDDDATGGWYTEVIRDIEEMPTAPRYIDDDEVPTGFRHVWISDGLSANVWEAIRRDPDPNDTYMDLWVTPGTARSIAAEFQHYSPTPRDAHAVGLDWIDVQPHWHGCPLEFVVVNAPPVFDRDAYNTDGSMVDPDGWGTGNLADVPAYAERIPATTYSYTDGRDMEWIDLGALGLVWIEESEWTGTLPPDSPVAS